MNGFSHAAHTTDDDKKWGFLIVGGSILGVAACVQLAYAGPPAQTLARLPAALVRSYEVAGKFLLTVPLAALGALLIAGNLMANRRPRPAARPTPPPVPRKTPSRAEFHMAPPPPPGSAAREEELEVGEPIPEEEQAQTESDRLRIPALPGRFEGRVAGDSTPLEQDPTAGRRKGTQSSVELASAKYLNRRPRSGRGSHQGA